MPVYSQTFESKTLAEIYMEGAKNTIGVSGLSGEYGVELIQENNLVWTVHIVEYIPEM